jgi:AraC-like DNA-binding protein
MFEFSMHPVHPFLKRYISSYIILHLNQDASFTTMFSAKPESVLMFNIGNNRNDVSIGFEFLNQPEKKYTFYNHQAWFGGLITKPLVGELFGHTQCVCAVLKPIGVHHLLKESAASVVNTGYSFETLGLHKYFDGLIDSLHGKTDKKEILQLVEHYFLKYFKEIELPFSIKDMTPVVNYIERQKGVVQIKQLEEKFHISERWLEKQFAAQVGLSPKEFARIIRFKSLVAQVMVTPSVSWGKIIADFGYYDQSHLIRDFQTFTGQSPTQFFKQILPAESIFDLNYFFYDECPI